MYMSESTYMKWLLISFFRRLSYLTNITVVHGYSNLLTQTVKINTQSPIKKGFLRALKVQDYL